MPIDNLAFSIFLIFTGAAALATLVLLTRQSLLIAYILLGVLIGPWGLKWITNAGLIKQTGEIGIIFLLFLLGLNLQPHKLLAMFRKMTLVAFISAVLFTGIGYGASLFFGLNHQEALIVGAAMMFSSTIIGLKLLPTTIMHHQHTGELMISVLLLQDLIAILVLLLINSASHGLNMNEVLRIALGLPCLILFAFIVERWILIKLLARFDQIQEYVFLVAIGWCLSMAELAHRMGLSMECGAFIAGVVLAEGPIALYISESLKPLRDFFLVLFFFSIGASFNLNYLPQVIKAAAIMAAGYLILKPWIFSLLLRWIGEKKSTAWEVGTRLGQGSEFSLLVAYLATSSASSLITDKVSYLIQTTTLITFVVSSYVVVWRYPTPLAISDRMRKQ